MIDALDQEVRRGQHQRNVFARTGFRLVGVDDQVVRLGARAGVVLRDERPLRAGREARAAAAAQPGVLDQRDDVVGLHRQGLLQRPVAVVAAVGRPASRIRGRPSTRLSTGVRRLCRCPCAVARGRRRHVAVVRAVVRWSRRLPCRVPVAHPRRPASVRRAGAARGPASRRWPSSGKPARMRTSRGRCTAAAPRVGAAGLPARSASTRSRADSGVWLSKNSQLTITTGAKSQAALHSMCSQGDLAVVGGLVVARRRDGLAARRRSRRRP